MPLDAGGERLGAAVHRHLLERRLPADARAITEVVRELDPLADRDVVGRVVDRVLARAVGLGPLDTLLADPDVSEVMVNGPGPVWIERNGALIRTPVTLDAPTIELLIERVVAPLGLRIDRTAPLVDARLPDGSRVNAVVPPLVIDGPCLTIRRFGARPIELGELACPSVAAFLNWSVTARTNIVVSGGTGAGKTTLLNALAGAIPRGERVVTVEDAAELRLPGEHVVRLEARPPNAEGVGGVGVRVLVRNSLRMRPDRIVVGEVRGPEALDMLQAMNTGHEGSLSTCHANSPDDALRRLETMVLLGDVALPLAAVREQLAAALDLVVHVARRVDGSRRVTAVAEVLESPLADGRRVRPLADQDGLVALPERPVRAPRRDAARPRVVAMNRRVLARSRAIDLAHDPDAEHRRRLVAPAWVRVLVADTAPGVAADTAWSVWIVATGWTLTVSAALGGAVLAGVAGLVAVAAPATFVASRRGRRDAYVEAELPAVLDSVARALRSGASLHMAIGEAAVRSTTSRADLAAIVDACERGESLATALDGWLEARPLPGVRLAVAALALAADTGGAAARAIDGVASTLRDRQAVARELRALSSQARLSAVVIAAAPIAFAAMAAGVDGATASFLLRTPVGAACLLTGLALDSIAVLWMARLTRLGP